MRGVEAEIGERQREAARRERRAVDRPLPVLVPEAQVIPAIGREPSLERNPSEERAVRGMRLAMRALLGRVMVDEGVVEIEEEERTGAHGCTPGRWNGP